jgi:hypothetical protein
MRARPRSTYFAAVTPEISVDPASGAAYPQAGMRRAAAIGFVLSAIAVRSAAAADVPVDGTRVRARARSVVFASRDRAWTLPPSVDGTPGMLQIDVSSPAHPEPRTLHVPPVAGHPGWTVGTDDTGTPRRYRFRNPSAPNGFSAVESIVWSASGSFRIVVRGTLLDTSTAQGGLRIRIGDPTNRHCARFDAASVVSDVPGSFTARDASAAGLSDCSSASLEEPERAPCVLSPAGGACSGSCDTDAECTFDVFANSCACEGGTGVPCGESAPVCNGYCPVGMHCGGVGPRSVLGRGCGCVSDGTVACGDGGYPACGDACPDPGMVCRPRKKTISLAGTSVGCECASMGACTMGDVLPTGSYFCGPGADCPPGKVCASAIGFFGCVADCADP